MKIKSNELVTLDGSKEPRVSTFNLFKGFGYKAHRNLKEVIFKNKEDFKEFGEVVTTTPVVGSKRKACRPETGFFLNEDQFILLSTYVKNSPESKSIKKQVTKEFSRMRKTLTRIFTRNSNIEWRGARKETKISTLEKNSTIKKFVEYAIAQGSTHSSYYYTAFAKSENSALFFIERNLKNIREIMNIRQLNKVKAADLIVENILEVEMTKNTRYKDIYKIVDKKLKDFSEMVGKSTIIMLEEQMQLKKLDRILALQ